MAEEEKNEQTEEKAPETEAPEKEAEQAPAEEEAPAEEPAAEGEEPATSPDTPAGEAEDVADAEDVDWKARRRLERSRRPAEARPQTSPEERASGRADRRGLASRSRSSYRRKQRQKGEPGTGTAPADRRPVGRKTRQGRVVSSKPDKTITVRIDIARRHPSYEKIVRRSGTLHAHDASNEANEGDLVRVVETRPLSRTKRWRLVEILEKTK